MWPRHRHEIRGQLRHLLSTYTMWVLGSERRSLDLATVPLPAQSAHQAHKCKFVCLFERLILFFSYDCFDGKYIYEPYACLVPVEVRKSHQVPCNWNYRWLWTIICTLGTEPGSFLCRSNKHSFNCWAIYPAPPLEAGSPVTQAGFQVAMYPKMILLPHLPNARITDCAIIPVLYIKQCWGLNPQPLHVS